MTCCAIPSGSMIIPPDITSSPYDRFWANSRNLALRLSQSRTTGHRETIIQVSTPCCVLQTACSGSCSFTPWTHWRRERKGTFWMSACGGSRPQLTSKEGSSTSSQIVGTGYHYPIVHWNPVHFINWRSSRNDLDHDTDLLYQHNSSSLFRSCGYAINAFQELTNFGGRRDEN